MNAHFSLIMFAGLFVLNTCKSTVSRETPANASQSIGVAEKEVSIADTSSYGDVKNQLRNLIQLVRVQDNKSCAPLMVYRGENLKRKWKDTCNYSFEEDKLHVDKNVARIRMLLDESHSHTFVAYRSDRESEGIWHVVETEFDLVEGKIRTVSFAFLKIGNTYCLGDID